MTARPPPDRDALSPEERELAARLSALDAGGPSAALDARILGAARAAAPASAPVRTRRPARRWPTAVGAVATLVVAVGLAWQLKPLIDMPPPLRGAAGAGTSTESDVLVHVDRLPARTPPAPSAAAAPPVQDATASAPRPRAGGGSPDRGVPKAAKAAPVVAPAQATAADDPLDYVDEAIGDAAVAAQATAPVAASPAAPPAPPSPPPEATARQARLAETQAAGTARSLDRVEVTGSRMGAPPVDEDAHLPPLDWLTRIRERRDAGDVQAARESLRRFVREYPRYRLPDDLRALRDAPR